MLVYLEACTSDFLNPPVDVEISELEGTWVAEYGSGVRDTVTIKSDGTFKQVFENHKKNYIYDSGWQKWTLQQVSKDFTYLHLNGGRYYIEGIPIGEAQGKKNLERPCLGNDCTWGLSPRVFYDPFTDTTTQMVDELILVPVKDKNGLILHHIWTSSDRGFAIIGRNREVFYKVQENLH